MNSRLLVTKWSPSRSAGVPLASLGVLAVSTYNSGAPGFLFGVVIVLVALILGTKAVSKMDVYPEALVVRLGPFGAFRRELGRDEVVLFSRQVHIYNALSIWRADGAPIVGPFIKVRMYDVWPEDVLREAGYHFAH